MIISKSFLISVAIDNHILNEANQNRILYENRALNEDQNYDIFLSHRYLDKVQVLALVHLFNREGFSVYVDWLTDGQLDRSNVDEQTADLLRKRMKSSKCLAYLTTQNIANSKWCPWELGYFDGLKNSKCCILPVMDYATDFEGQEYLGLYPYLEYVDRTSYGIRSGFYICDKNHSRFIKLKDWFNNF